jgi:hypothetical protein
MGRKLGPYTKRKTYMDSVCEEGAEEDTWT